ncbi:MAG: M20/M25/M40 family metallo-hydrolase, partial [Alistipes sp.]|nr:M20/M25/M40 family metallo-hydrolase [Alistipes sp.]
MQYFSLDSCVELLCRLVSTPSVSGSEKGTADILFDALSKHGAKVNRLHNNIWVASEGYDSAKPTLLLNSHHDTVKPAGGYTFDPYLGKVVDGKVLGLGSNDAGGSVVSLVAAFSRFSDTTKLPFNLILAITAEEETMGPEGMRAMLAHFAEHHGIGEREGDKKAETILHSVGREHEIGFGKLAFIALLQTC